MTLPASTPGTSWRALGKDVGAAAVLIAAFSAAVIGLLVLGPPLWERLRLLAWALDAADPKPRSRTGVLCHHFPFALAR